MCMEGDSFSVANIACYVKSEGRSASEKILLSIVQRLQGSQKTTHTVELFMEEAVGADLGPPPFL